MGSGGSEPSLPAVRPLLVTFQTCVSFSLASKYYEKEALLMDPVDGPILASLLGKTWCSGLGCQERLPVAQPHQNIAVSCPVLPGPCSGLIRV
jgi:hypothetical protein